MDKGTFIGHESSNGLKGPTIVGATVYLSGAIDFHDAPIDQGFHHYYLGGYAITVNVCQSDDILVMREEARGKAAILLQDWYW